MLLIYLFVKFHFLNRLYQLPNQPINHLCIMNPYSLNRSKT